MQQFRVKCAQGCHVFLKGKFLPGRGMAGNVAHPAGQASSPCLQNRLGQPFNTSWAAVLSISSNPLDGFKQMWKFITKLNRQDDFESRLSSTKGKHWFNWFYLFRMWIPQNEVFDEAVELTVGCLSNLSIERGCFFCVFSPVKNA